MAIWILRLAFAAIAILVAVSLIVSVSSGETSVTVLILLAMLLPIAIMIVDWAIPQKRLETISSLYFGILIGLFMTYMIGIVTDPFFTNETQYGPILAKYRPIMMIFVGISCCYLCTSLLWQTRDDFRFIIPYVEFSRDVKGMRPYLLDTSVVIDGRIADIAETGILDNQLVMPRFVLNELQNIADSSDKMRRSRGRRGLDVLNRLRNSESIDFKIYEREFPEMEGEPVDLKLILLARHLEGKIVTGDYNLNKVARLQNVPVINLNEIANSLKPVFLPGDSIEVKVVKPGEESVQGIGYLDDGTMVVVEDGREFINQKIRITVTSMLQTNAGRMVFGRHGDVPDKSQLRLSQRS